MNINITADISYGYDTTFDINLRDVKSDLHYGILECSKRGLLQSAKWLAELSHGLKNIKTEISKDNSTDISDQDNDNFTVAKTYFDAREYDRAAYFMQNCESPVPKFMHLYSLYLAKEKRRLDSLTDNSNLNESRHVKDLSDLLSTLKSDYNARKLDGYGLYLYAVVLKKLDLNELAINVFIESVHAKPMLWAAWLELAHLIEDKEKLYTLNLPNHWMRKVFLGHVSIDLHLNDDGLKQFEDLQTAGFDKCVYIISQMALAYHNKRDVDKAIEYFQHLQEIDPYRLDNLDTFSNLLFVKEMKTEMAYLAHKAVEIDKYRPETCCVIGNYYSIRCDHQKAIWYFQRALKLNPQYLSAWTLMGHEFMEMKNTNAAIQSYRKAVEVNKRDYRAWYGLGQAYEILKMSFFSLYYFKISHQLRPHDSRMLVALGETYEKLDKIPNAIKCFKKAVNVGDIEGVALFKLASMYEKMGDMEKAIPAYLTFSMDERASLDKVNLHQAYITLANYYEGKGNFDEASCFAYKCLESEEKKTEAKALLKTIENKRDSIHKTPETSQTKTNKTEDQVRDGVCMDETDMVIEMFSDTLTQNSGSASIDSSRNMVDSSVLNADQNDVNHGGEQNTPPVDNETSMNISNISID